MQQPGVPVQQPGFPVQQPGVPVQQPGVPMQQPGFPVQQPVFWSVPSGSSASGTVTMSYAGVTGTQVQNPGQVQVCIYMQNVISDVYT